MNWIGIRGSNPPIGKPLLFKEMFTDNYHVGFWDEEENCMIEFSDGSDGWKWSVEKWTAIE